MINRLRLSIPSSPIVEYLPDYLDFEYDEDYRLGRGENWLLYEDDEHIEIDVELEKYSSIDILSIISNYIDRIDFEEAQITYFFDINPLQDIEGYYDVPVSSYIKDSIKYSFKNKEVYYDVDRDDFHICYKLDKNDIEKENFIKDSYRRDIRYIKNILEYDVWPPEPSEFTFYSDIDIDKEEVSSKYRSLRTSTYEFKLLGGKIVVGNNSLYIQGDSIKRIAYIRDILLDEFDIDRYNQQIYIIEFKEHNISHE
jgi:hypothetical protein